MKFEQVNSVTHQRDGRGSQLSRTTTSFPPGFICGGIVCLFALMLVVMACGSDAHQQVPSLPANTLTVVFGQSNASPTPPLSPFYCGGWATDTTPV